LATIASGVVFILSSIDEHLGECAHGEIFLAKVIIWKLGWEKTLSEDR
jgi:hypothetical protein